MSVPRVRLFHRVLVVALLFAMAGFASADDAPFQEAVQHFQQAAAGDDGAIDMAADEFQALAQAHPEDALLLAYAGAAQAMRSRATMLPWKKMSYADDGISKVDKALTSLSPADDARLHRSVPGSLETRFIAASLFLGLPEMFHRQARGQQLLADVLASPLLAQAPLQFRGAVWLRAGQAAAQAARKVEARRWYGQVVGSNAPQAALAKARLQELGP